MDRIVQKLCVNFLSLPFTAATTSHYPRIVLLSFLSFKHVGNNFQIFGVTALFGMKNAKKLN